jgi:hypothetical protein
VAARIASHTLGGASGACDREAVPADGVPRARDALRSVHVHPATGEWAGRALCAGEYTQTISSYPRNVCCVYLRTKNMERAHAARNSLAFAQTRPQHCIVAMLARVTRTATSSHHALDWPVLGCQSVGFAWHRRHLKLPRPRLEYPLLQGTIFPFGPGSRPGPYSAAMYRHSHERAATLHSMVARSRKRMHM